MNLAVEAVTFTYAGGVTALREVSLHVQAGEAVALIGQNGAGKSTLARHLNGLLRPQQGRVTVGEWDTATHSPAQLAARVGYVFQNPGDQLFQRTVWAEAAFGPRNLGWPTARVEAAVRAALEAVGLGDAERKHPYDLAAGERKRLALASVLAMETPIVVLDEPTTAQDAAGVAGMGQLVNDLRRQGRTVFTISHDLDFCAEHFERVVVMAEGRVLADGPARAVLARADLLAQADVEPPQMMRLAARLNWGERPWPLTVEEFVKHLAGGEGDLAPR